MEKRDIFAIIFVVLTVGLFLSGIWLWQQPKIKFSIIKQFTSTENVGLLPTELSQDFDPTISQAMFKVNGKGSNENSLRMSYVFPPIVVGLVVDSILVCEKGITMRLANQSKGRFVTILQALELIKLENEPIMLTGMCDDEICDRIVGKCDIYLSGKVK
jgi:hypothetical protein